MDVGLPPQDFENSEILDLHIDSHNSSVAVLTSQKLRVLDLGKGKIRWAKDNFEVGSVKCNLRGVRFGGYQTDGLLFLVLNSANKKQAYIQKYDINEWKLVKTTNVSPKPITAFNISEQGHLLACGSSDMSIFVLDVYSMSKIIRIPNVHSFPVTAIDFNIDATLVLSGSADGTIVAARVPEVVLNTGMWTRMCWIVFITLLGILLTLAFVPLELLASEHGEL